MIFDEIDIDFSKLDSLEFEELCFDILNHLGFYSLTWRQGGSDHGRDIEGYFAPTNPLVKSYSEKWFFECKHHKKGVGIEKISTKIAWADAMKPKHLAIMVSSYVTDDTRDWLEQIRNGKPYQIHIIEGKFIKNLILKYPNLVNRYFIDKYLKLLNDIKRNWISLNLFPEPNMIIFLDKKLNNQKVDLQHKAFLWCIYHLKKDEINKWFQTRYTSPEINYFGSIDLESFLLSNSNIDTHKTIFSGYSNIETISVSKTWQGAEEENSIQKITAQLLLQKEDRKLLGLYSFTRNSFNPSEGLEVLVEGDENLSTNIRHIRQDVSDESQKSFVKMNKNLKDTPLNESIYYLSGRWINGEHD